MDNHSRKEDGRPSQQWYWDDWFSSHDVQSCSFAAQGLWINMLGIMFSSQIRGTLTINGVQMDNKAIAKRFGNDLSEINKLIIELEDERVFDRLEDGTIISRRMYRESKKKNDISNIRSAAGKKGMGSRWHGSYNKTDKINNKANNKDITNITGVNDNKDDDEKITKITASSPTPSSSPTPPPKERKDILTDIHVSEIDKRLVQMLIDMMLDNNPESHIISRLTEKRQHEWINSCRLMREKDNRTSEQIEALIKFSQNDNFWKANILSFPKLREKQDTLILQYKRNHPSQSGIMKWYRIQEEKYGKKE